MRPEAITAESEILGIILFVILPVVVCWAAGTLFAYHNEREARRLVHEVDSRKERARARLMRKDIETARNRSHRAVR